MYAGQFRYRTQTGSFAQTVNRQTLNIDLGQVLVALYVRLRFTCTNSGVAPVGPVFNQQLAFLKRLELIINGRDTVWSVTPAIYASRCKYERAGNPIRGMETAMSQAVNGVSNVDVTIPMIFDAIGGRKRNDAGIDLRANTIGVAQLAATFGSVAATDLWTTPNGAAITAVQLDVEAEYIANVPAVQNSGKNKGKPHTFLVRQLSEESIPLQQSSNQFLFDVDQRSGNVIRNIHLTTLTANAGDDAPLANGWVIVRSGSDTFLNMQTPVLKAMVRENLRIMPAAAMGVGSGEDVGVNWLDFQYMGKLTTAILTGKLSADLLLSLNATLGGGPTNFVAQIDAVRPSNFA